MGQFIARFKYLLTKTAPDLKHYSKKSFMRDLGAGLSVGIIALPLSLALAVACGVPPIWGLYTAGVAGFLAALFSGSPYSVSGPGAAMVPILAAIVYQHGTAALPYIGMLAAIFLGIFAALGIGKYIRKVPESVVLGFTAGVAIVIFCGQLNSFFGLTGIEHHETFVDKLFDTTSHLATANLPTLVVGVITVAILLFWNRVPKLGALSPTLIAVVVATLLTAFVPIFGQLATIGSAFGQLPIGLPSFIPFDFGRLADNNLWLPAFEVAALIAIESLLCAVVADRLTKHRHRSNQELFAQGVGNVGAALVGGIPATAVIARTGTIIKSGAKSRVASVIHALVVIGFMVALAPLAVYIPLTALSAVLLVTAVRISEFNEIVAFVKAKSWRLSAVLALTLILTVFTDLVIGVSAGLILHLAFAAHNRLLGSRDKDGPLQLAEEEA